MKEDKNDITTNKIDTDFKKAFDAKRNWLTEAMEDFKFVMGQQWDGKDIDDLKAKGVLALTINKIRPNINLLLGIESQNRSDFMAFPEHKENSLEGEIATALIKNVMKGSQGQYKVSQAFEDGLICGECYLEPWIDYTKDIINGDMKLRKCSYLTVFPEPGFEEYDLSDARYIIKLTLDLTQDQIISMFPDKEDEIEKMRNGRIDMQGFSDYRDFYGASVQKHGYNDTNQIISEPTPIQDDPNYEPMFDLVEYYYKKWVKKYYVVQLTRDNNGKIVSGKLKLCKDKKEAKQLTEATNLGTTKGMENMLVKERLVPEVWIASKVGGSDILLEDKVSDCYPRYDNFPFIPYFAHRMTIPLKYEDRHLLVQGIVRGMKLLNMEYNKRRTQMLRHLNSSANSGIVAEKNVLVDKHRWQQYGSTAGIILEVEEGKMGAWKRIDPSQLSSGHVEAAEIVDGDIEEAAGIRKESLAMESGNAKESGKAIALRQKQGMVMVQKFFDNLSQTKRILGRFILSQLGNLFDVEEAIKIMGDSWIRDNFSEPVLKPSAIDGKPTPVMLPNGQMQMDVNKQKVVQTFNDVLNDVGLGKYDVAIGENLSNETIRYGNYMMMMDMIEKGLPIPPDLLIEESTLSNATKEKIKVAIEQAQMMAKQQANSAPQKPEPKK